MSPAAARTWYVYVLECRRGILYTGIALDVEERFAAHLAGRGAAFTRIHPPLRILAAAELADRSEATRAEAALKKLPRPAKLAWVRANGWRASGEQSRPPSAFDEEGAL
jgi:putative endonuclease